MNKLLSLFLFISSICFSQETGIKEIYRSEFVKEINTSNRSNLNKSFSLNAKLVSDNLVLIYEEKPNISSKDYFELSFDERRSFIKDRVKELAFMVTDNIVYGSGSFYNLSEFENIIYEFRQLTSDYKVIKSTFHISTSNIDSNIGYLDRIEFKNNLSEIFIKEPF
ncbi:MAG: hypothetical protein ACWA5P_02030 [bacterium]